MSEPDVRTDVENAIANALHSSDEMVTKWLACIETVGTDGARGLWMIANEDATAWDTLGMLTHALQREQARAAADLLSEEESDG